MNPNAGVRRCIAAILFVPSAAAAAPADEIKALLDQAKPAAACELARQHPERMGDAIFDFHYGVACIEGGRVGEGVLAIERYLLLFPENLSARLTAARGYFLLGDDDQARAEFAEIRALSPPADVSAAIDRYVEAIATRKSRSGIGSAFFVEVGGGRDTNVNAGPAASEVLLPGFGLQPLDASSRKYPDNFLSVGGGGYVTHALRPGLTAFANLQGDRRWHGDEGSRAYELGNLNVAAGLSLARDKHLLRASALYGFLEVGASRFRSSSGGSLEWQYALGNGRALTAGALALRLEHGAGNEPRDADLYALSIGARQQLSHPWNPVIAVAVSGGEQRSRTGFDELVPRMLGANASLALAPHARLGVLLGYTYQRNRYQGPDFFAYPEHRLDRYQALNATLSWMLTRHWSLRLEALTSRNRSNSEVYSFPRDLVALKLRFDSK